MVKEKEKEKEKQSPGKSGDPATPDSMADLEVVLASFVQTFESSAQRWEQTVYPFIKSFEASAKRWERMVYPAIIVFGILGLSGFWLIYSLTTDVHELARNVDPKMERNLALMAANISKLSGSVESMTSEVRDMQIHIHNMDNSIFVVKDDMGAISKKLDTLPPLLQTIAEMNQSMKAITINTGVMSHDVRGMNENVGRPMSFMNSFAPW